MLLPSRQPTATEIKPARKPYPKDVIKRPWTTEEIDILYKMTSSHSIPSILEKVNELAEDRGWHQRNYESVKRKLNRLGLSTKATIDNVSLHFFARQLGVDISRVRHWLKRGMPTTKIGGLRTVNIGKFRKWASGNEYYISGLSISVLEWLFECDADDDDSAAADFCKRVAAAPYLPARKKAVIRLPDGKRFDSVTEAAASCFYQRHRISTAIRNGHEVGGYRWKMADGVTLGWAMQRNEPGMAEGNGC